MAQLKNTTINGNLSITGSLKHSSTSTVENGMCLTANNASGTAADLLWTYPTTLNASTDNRDVSTTPADYRSKFKISGLKYNSKIGRPSSVTYSAVLGLSPWPDNSGGYSHELAFNNDGIFHRIEKNNTTWDSWKQALEVNSSGTLNKNNLSFGNPSGSYPSSWSDTLQIGSNNNVDYTTTSLMLGSENSTSGAQIFVYHINTSNNKIFLSTISPTETTISTSDVTPSTNKPSNSDVLTNLDVILTKVSGQYTKRHICKITSYGDGYVVVDSLPTSIETEKIYKLISIKKNYNDITFWNAVASDVTFVGCGYTNYVKNSPTSATIGSRNTVVEAGASFIIGADNKVYSTDSYVIGNNNTLNTGNYQLCTGLYNYMRSSEIGVTLTGYSNYGDAMFTTGRFSKATSIFADLRITGGGSSDSNRKNMERLDANGCLSVRSLAIKTDDALVGSNSVLIDSSGITTPSLSGSFTIDQSQIPYPTLAKNNTAAGSMTFLEKLYQPSLSGTNVFDYLTPESITDEYSIDGGSTWKSYNKNARSKLNIFSKYNFDWEAYYLGNGDKTDLTKNQLRLTIDFTKTSIYCAPTVLYMFVSINSHGNHTVTVEVSRDGTTYSERCTAYLSGWGGWNCVNIAGESSDYWRFNNSSQNNDENCWKYLRLTFKQSNNTSYTLTNNMMVAYIQCQCRNIWAPTYSNTFPLIRDYDGSNLYYRFDKKLKSASNISITDDNDYITKKYFTDNHTDKNVSQKIISSNITDLPVLLAPTDTQSDDTTSAGKNQSLTYCISDETLKVSNISINGTSGKITGIASTTESTDAASKSYVDSQVKSASVNNFVVIDGTKYKMSFSSGVLTYTKI